ncbi:MAG: YihA family ribosome biogenesis GTP-binding protein [Deltaproteobacteria bacterium]|nr:YihA family ribosome biogenesis GTP-binding protein [Deltaproteobacteria bacterium]MBW2253593.1 YihA family ribosome biogenesis GTP-binding protein [Deltaproteobacteria bacterium]
MRNHPRGVEFLGSFFDELPEIGLPEVAFAGRSNVGKSSAINCLLNRKRVARVSGRPGRTQSINLFQLDERMVFADLPGYGFAHVPPHVQAEWKRMVEGYLANRPTLRLVVILVDARRTPQVMDGTLIFGLVESHIPALVVATKVDKLKRNERRKNLQAIRDEFRLSPAQFVPFSAVTREGRDAVWSRIEAACVLGS